MNNQSSLVMNRVTKSFGKHQVLHDVSLELSSGMVMGLIGLNGAGKTTLFRILLGLMKQDSGTCTVLGFDPSAQQRDYYRRVGVVLEHNGFFGNLTIEENLVLYAQARAISRSAIIDYYNEYWVSTSIAPQKGKVKYLSRGQKMQCALCRAFIGWPSVYYFDEPAVALDIHAYDHFCTMIKKAQHNGAIILISSHQMEAIEQLCTHVCVLKNGVLSLVNNTHHADVESWIIRSDFSPSYQSIIQAVSIDTPSYGDGCWRCTFTPDAEQIMPRLIADLVRAGCGIIEVTRLKKDFRDSIRSLCAPDVGRDEGLPS